MAEGAIASVQSAATTHSAPGNADLAPRAPTELSAPAVAPGVPAPRADVDMLREQRLAESEAVPWPGSGTGPSAAGAQDSNTPDTRQTGSGPLEFDR